MSSEPKVLESNLSQQATAEIFAAPSNQEKMMSNPATPSYDSPRPPTNEVKS